MIVALRVAPSARPLVGYHESEWTLFMEQADLPGWALELRSSGLAMRRRLLTQNPGEHLHRCPLLPRYSLEVGVSMLGRACTVVVTGVWMAHG